MWYCRGQRLSIAQTGQVTNLNLAALCPMLKVTKREVYEYMLHVVIPIFTGGVIYLLFRSPKLLMFKWADSIRISNNIEYFRQLVIDNNFQIPNWAAFSLPDALWGYSLTAFMIITWKNNFANKSSFFWLCIGPLFCIMPELGQMEGIISGTFDRCDLLFCVVASILPFIFFQRYFKGVCNNER